jgi:hypothetical protein
LVLFFCAVNLFFFAFVQPYRGFGPELLYNQDFSRGLLGWEFDGASRKAVIDQDVITIDHADKKLSTTLLQCSPKELFPKQLILSAESMSHGVKKGEVSWHEARIDLVDYDIQDVGVYGKTLLIAMQGDTGWVSSQRLFTVNPSAHKRCVEISLYSSPGQFKVRNLSLKEGERVEAYGWGRNSLIIGWVLLGLCIGRHLYRHYRYRVQGRYLLFLLPLVIGGILMPIELKLLLEKQVILLLSYVGFHLSSPDLLQDRGLWDLWPAVWDLSKISHLVGFLLISLVLFSEKRANVGFLLLGLLLLALSSELLQFFVPERTPRLSDLTVDTLGVLSGWLLLLVVRGIRQTP